MPPGGIDWIWTPPGDDDDETSSFGLNEWIFDLSDEEEDA